MQSGRLRTSQLWFRITLARLKSVPYLTPVLVVALVTTVVVGPSLSPRENILPDPGPSEPTPAPAPTPSRRVDPTRTLTEPISRTSAPTPTPPPPSSEPSRRQAPSRRPAPSDPVTRSTPPPAPPSTPPSIPSSAPPSSPPSSPSLEPLVLTADLSQSGNSPYTACDADASIRFTGTIGVSRTAVVTARWEPAMPSNGPGVKEITAGSRLTVARRVAVSGQPGQTRRGTV
ncbi:MAG: hypothetical protein ABW046_17120, partial [Actinoplanes sp.]